MANLSELTRKEQVLAVLKEHVGLWVDGTLLANEQVGGSEGLKRLRELRQEGFLIQQRKHPDPRRSISQYRLVEQTSISGEPSVWVPKENTNGRAPVHDRPVGGDLPPRRDTAAPARAAVPASGPSAAPGFWNETRQGATNSYDWKPAKKAPGTLEYVFWIGKQRVIAAIGELGDGRWGWGVLVPANKSRMTPERRAGHGVQPNKQSAMEACELRVREMRESGEYR